MTKVERFDLELKPRLILPIRFMADAFTDAGPVYSHILRDEIFSYYTAGIRIFDDGTITWEASERFPDEPELNYSKISYVHLKDGTHIEPQKSFEERAEPWYAVDSDEDIVLFDAEGL